MDDWDAPACQACHGTGRILLVGGPRWIEVSCAACHGTGNEGAAPPEPLAPPAEETRGPAGQQAGVASGLCDLCLGAQVVVTARLAEVPCPRCG